MIRTHGLTKRFDGFTAVEDLTLDVREGEVLGLLGPNGAGKTTTVRMLAGLIAPTSGEATVCGHPVGAGNGAIRRSIGMLTEVPGLYEQLSARRNLEIYARLHGVDDAAGRAARYLDLLDLAGWADEPAGAFSKGMKQKLAIGRALIHEPRLIFLDEPTSGLDPRMTKVVREFIRGLHAEGRTILLCTHNLDEAQRLCDRIALLQTRLVALDRTEALRGRLFGRRTIVCLRGGSEGALAAARALAYVSGARIDAGRLVVEMDDPGAHTPEFVRRIVEAGAEILSIAEEEHSLEEIYLKLLERAEGADRDAGPNRVGEGHDGGEGS